MAEKSLVRRVLEAPLKLDKPEMLFYVPASTVVTMYSGVLAANAAADGDVKSVAGHLIFSIIFAYISGAGTVDLANDIIENHDREYPILRNINLPL